MKIGELSSTARRSNSPAQSINQRLLNHPRYFSLRSPPPRPLWQQIRGAVSLAGTSFERVTLRVQQMHLRIADVTFRNLAMAPVVNVGAAAFRPLHHGVTNGIYRIVRGVGGVAFKALDLALAGMARSQNPPLAAKAIPAPVVSAVNGAFGDYLLRNRNPLALRMASGLPC